MFVVEVDEFGVFVMDDVVVCVLVVGIDVDED